MLKFIGLVATVAGGFGVGRTASRVQVRRAILTAGIAAMAQASLSFVLPHVAIEQIARSYRYAASSQIEVIGPQHAPYELGLLLSPPFGAIGFLVGRFTRRRRKHSPAAEVE